MYKESQKLHLIEEVLKTNDDTILAEIETVLNRRDKVRDAQPFSAHEFAGRWGKKDAALIEKAIEEACEQINEDEWK